MSSYLTHIFLVESTLQEKILKIDGEKIWTDPYHTNLAKYAMQDGEMLH